MPTIAQAVFFGGAILGGLIFGWMADRYGRIPALVWTNLIGFMAGIATAFVTTFWAFCVCRFLVGLAFDNCFTMMYILGKCLCLHSRTVDKMPQLSSLHYCIVFRKCWVQTMTPRTLIEVFFYVLSPPQNSVIVPYLTQLLCYYQKISDMLFSSMALWFSGHGLSDHLPPNFSLPCCRRTVPSFIH